MDSINKDSGKYIRHSLRSTNSNASTPTPNGNGSSLGAFTAKDEQTPDKVKHDYAEIDRLTVDKVRLCEKLNALIARVRVRLDHDLKKVLILQGDLDPSKSTPALTATPSFSTNITNAGHLANTGGLVAAIGTGVGGAATNTGNAIAMSGAGMPSGLGPSGYSGTVHGVARNPVQMMNESLRNAMAGVEPLIAQQQQQQQPGIVSTPTATANNKRTFTYMFRTYLSNADLIGIPLPLQVFGRQRPQSQSLPSSFRAQHPKQSMYHNDMRHPPLRPQHIDPLQVAHLVNSINKRYPRQCLPRLMEAMKMPRERKTWRGLMKPMWTTIQFIARVAAHPLERYFPLLSDPPIVPDS